jgi:hypothetical protein
MTTAAEELREKLHRLVDELDQARFRDALDHVEWLINECESLTDEEMQEVLAAEEEMRRGQYVTLDELKRRLGM